MTEQTNHSREVTKLGNSGALGVSPDKRTNLPDTNKTDEEIIEEIRKQGYDEELDYSNSYVRQAISKARKSEREKIIEKLDKFMQERKTIRYDKYEAVTLIKILPFEWEDFKKELEKTK
jgi:hypothetical protein